MQIFYHDEARTFIKILQKPTQSKVVRGIILLEHYGNSLNMPHVKKVTRELSELRIRGQQEVRILFTVRKGNAYLLHGFVKKTQKIPEREIKTAETRLQLLT